jgi:DNA primase
VGNVVKNWPEQLIEEIKDKVDIVNLVSEHLLLQKKGKNYLGLCPFHHEKTPSFNVNSDKQMFYCFGCQAGGNVYSFLMKKENIPFGEAVKVLAERAGVSLPQAELSPEEQAKFKLRETIEQINKATRDFYHDTLLNSLKAQTARDYLAKRGIDYTAIDSFFLGYAPDGWSNLMDFLSGRGYSVKQMLEAGVATPKDSGGGYDRFRNRIMFPITNVKGQVIGFGGRVLDDSLPKYLNSPETAFFSKGHNLYGMDLAHKSIRDKDETMVVEGYMDVIAAHQTGFNNAVASLGTALTRDQGKLLMRYTHNVLLAYDSDAAGVNAAVKGAEILRDLGCKLKILTVPDGKDPDEYLRNHQPEEFARLGEKAPGLIQYKLEKIIKERPPTTIEARVETVNKLMDDLLKVDNLVEREGLIRLLATTLGITEEVIYAEIRRISSKSRKNQANSDNFRLNSNTNIGHARTEIGNVGRENVAQSGLYNAENLLIRLMLEEPKVIALVNEQLDWTGFNDPGHLKLVMLIKEAWDKGSWDPANLTSVIQDEALATILAKMSLHESGVNNASKAALDCIKIIKNEQVQLKIKKLQEQAQVMQNNGDMVGALTLLQQINQLVKQSAARI